VPKLPTLSKPQNLISAALVDFKGDLSKRWYINIHLRDSITGEAVRFRISKAINKYPYASQRQEYARKYIDQLSQMLASGYHFTSKTKFDTLQTEVPKTDLSQISLQEAIQKFIEYKTNTGKKTVNRFKATLTYLQDYERKHRPIQLAKVETTHIDSILKHFQSSRNLSPKTFNHYRSVFFSVFKFFIDLGVLTRNPVALIHQQRVQKGKMHFPLTLEEVSTIKAYALSKGDHQFILFMSLCFYALIRPGKELRLMRVRDIDANSIWVNAENAKTDESRRVEMVLPLKKLIQAQNLHQYNPNHYLFTQAGHPGEVPVGPGYFYKKQKRFLKAVGLANRGHDLYCYKHSGAIQMIKAGLTAFDVMKMAGHKDVQITMDYLYNIGAITRLDGKGDNMPEI